MAKPRKKRITKAMKAFAATLADTQNFTVKDFKRHCIVRGMPFEEISKQNIHDMRMFIFKHKGDIDPTLLDKYDEWLEKYLKDLYKERGEKCPESYFHPLLRLGFIGEEDDDGNVKRKRVKGIKKAKKKKRERTKDGIFAGTKKALTFSCAKEGMTLADTVSKVIEVFEDAKEKSISIWYKRALKDA